MKPSDISEALDGLIDARQSVFIWGGPGVGKSGVVRQFAERRSLPLRDVRALLLDPVDLRGLPYLSEGRSKWATPDFLPQDGAGVLFLDELNAAPPMVQASCYQLVLDRKLGEYVLPDGGPSLPLETATQIVRSRAECRHHCGTGSSISTSK